jgi:hypothetical protein
MLKVPARTWTVRQKSVIIAGAVLCVAALVSLIYLSERSLRPPGQEILYGMWYGPNFFTNDPGYLKLSQDGAFSFGAIDFDGELYELFTGRWYAGGTKIHLLFDPDTVPRRPWVLHIVDIEGDELRIRFFRDDDVLSYRRVNSESPNASNQAMQLTASKPAIYAFSGCRRASMLRAMRTGLAAADLVSR